MFHRERDAEYDEITTAARALDDARQPARRGSPAPAPPPRRGDRPRLLRRARPRRRQARGRRGGGANSRRQREGAPAQRRRRASARTAPPGSPVATSRSTASRSAWLIRRFVDPAARFSFVDPATYRHAPGELRFDMFEGEYGHEGERCTFETLLARFGLDEPALRRVGEVVHDLDCKESRFGHAEAAGVAAMVQGIAAAHERDEERLQARAAAVRGALPELPRRELTVTERPGPHDESRSASPSPAMRGSPPSAASRPTPRAARRCRRPLLRRAARLGPGRALSFGGPAGQIAVMHRILVERSVGQRRAVPPRAQLLHAAAGARGAAARDLHRLAAARHARRARRRHALRAARLRRHPGA